MYNRNLVLRLLPARLQQAAILCAISHVSDYRTIGLQTSGTRKSTAFRLHTQHAKMGASALKIAIVWGIVCCYSLEIYLISLKLKFSVRLGYPRRPRAGIQDSGSINSGTWAKSSEYLYLHLLESALPVLVHLFLMQQK